MPAEAQAVSWSSLNVQMVPTGIQTENGMDVEKTITEIEWLEHLYSLPDKRQLVLADRYAANQRHDEMYANNPWFQLWKRYGM